MRGRRRAMALAAVAAVALPAAAGRATPPGANGRIAFTRFADADRTWGALFAANRDGTGVRRLTRPRRGVVDGEPDWSPDGRKIAFEHGPALSRGKPAPLIYTANADGSEARPLAPCTGGCAGQASPAWSPDGLRIAFSSGSRTHEEIWVVNGDGSGLRQLTHPSGVYDQQPQWAPDGKRLVLQRVDPRTGGLALVVVNADASGERRITPWSLRAGDHPDWSPDGRRILFRSNVGGRARGAADIYTVRPDGSGLRRLTRARGKAQHLSSSFSPDGRWIAFARTPGAGRNGYADVFVMRADGTGMRRVTRSPLWDSSPDWGPVAAR